MTTTEEWHPLLEATSRLPGYTLTAGNTETTPAVYVKSTDVGVDLKCPAGTSAVIEMTSAPKGEIVANNASWHVWDAGTVTNGQATRTVYGCSALRLRCIAGAAESARAHVRQ
jgi:hypothetical protein